MRFLAARIFFVKYLATEVFQEILPNIFVMDSMIFLFVFPEISFSGLFWLQEFL